MKKIFLIILTIFFSIIATSISYAEKTYTEIKDTVFRLHIIANSDSEYDQQLKLEVRDNILQYLSNKNFKSKKETIEYICSHLEEINNIVSNTLNENNCIYSFSTEITNSYFPTKHYSNISLPAGEYDCLKINLNNAKGQNWWCILYPNLCSTNVTISNNSNILLEKSITSETYNIITNEVTYKFKIVELIQSLKNKVKL
ncbi:MAG: stage II sporulation protein R [Clostridiales bacterium]|nr:stage II sporulation protein R [Clostridiales bacterium]